MKVFLCGGGAGEKTVEANKRLNEVIDHSKPCLYIPLAMEAEMYDSCYEWIQGELSSVDITGIHMVRSAEELACVLDDPNDVKLTDIDGYDVLDGISVLCHFGNRTAEEDEASRQFLLELSLRRKAVALPEEVTLFVNDGQLEIIGDRPYYLFKDGVMLEKKGAWV